MDRKKQAVLILILCALAFGGQKIDSLYVTKGTKIDSSLTISKFGAGLVHSSSVGLLTSSSLTAAECAAAVSGTTNYVAKFTGANTVGNSAWLAENGTGVGIGTTGPGYTLQVIGNIAIQNAASNTGALLNFLGSSSGKNWLLANRNNVQGFELTPSTANGGATFSTPAMVILDGGNVGIGTTSPQAQLHVYTSTGSTISVDGPTTTQQTLQFLDAGVAKTLLYRPANYDAFRIAVGGTDRLTILDNNGCVGLGTAAPGKKLDVSGCVKADSVLINVIPATGTVIPTKYFILYDASGNPHKVPCD